MNVADRTSSATTASALRAVSRWVVNGVVSQSVPNDWNEFVAAAERHRLLGAVLGAVDAGIVVASRDEREALIARVMRRTHLCLAIEASLVHAVEVLTRHEIACYVLKGVATAHLDYPDPSMREFNDADLLIESGQVSAAISALECAGLRRDLPPRTEDWDEHYAKDITMIDESNVEIDVHRTLAAGAFGFWVDRTTLTSSPEEFELGGIKIAAASPTVRVLHAAFGLTVAEPRQRLAHVVDFALAARRVAQPNDIAELAAAWNCGLLLEEAHRTVTTVLGSPPTMADGNEFVLPESARRPRRERLARRCYRSGGGTNTAELLSGFIAMESIREVGGYMRGLFRPAPEYRGERRTLGRSTEWRTAAQELRATFGKSR